MVDHCDQLLKNSLAYCGHTGAAVSGCGGDDAGVTAPHPLRKCFYLNHYLRAHAQPKPCGLLRPMMA